jgi:hypothetical protein
MLTEAAATLDQARGLSGAGTWLSAAFVAQKAAVLVQAGSVDTAVAELRSAAGEAKALGARMIQLRALGRLVELADGQDRDEALSELRTLLDDFTEGGDNPDIAEARQIVGPS